MPHLMIDEIASRKGEKVAAFVTVEQATGVIVGGVLPFLLIFRILPWWMTLLIVATGIVVGVLATTEVGGLAFYERMIWMVRGHVHARMGNQRLFPDDIGGARQVEQRDAAVRVGGAVRRVRVSPPVRSQRPRAGRVALDHAERDTAEEEVDTYANLSARELSD